MKWRRCARDTADDLLSDLRLWRPADAGGPPLKGRRQAWFASAGGYVEAGVYDRYALPTGEWFDGPAIVEERETTTVVGPGSRFGQDAMGHLVIELPKAEGAR